MSIVDGGAATWPVPALIPLRGSSLGAADFTLYYPFKVPRFRLKAGISQMTSTADTTLIPPGEWRSFQMQDQFDALLYLGDPSTITRSEVGTRKQDQSSGNRTMRNLQNLHPGFKSVRHLQSKPE